MRSIIMEFVIILFFISLYFMDEFEKKFNTIEEENINYFEPQKGDFYFNSSFSRSEAGDEECTIKEKYHKDTVDFELYANDYSDYGYYIWINTIDTGTVYFKAVRIGKRWDRNSLELEKETEMKVHNQSNGFVKCGPKFFYLQQDFLEVDDRYLARFELWYKPKNGGKERKLATKIYKVHLRGM
jgi:hypothetical protein